MAKPRNVSSCCCSTAFHTSYLLFVTRPKTEWLSPNCKHHGHSKNRVTLQCEQLRLCERRCRHCVSVGCDDNSERSVILWPPHHEGNSACSNNLELGNYLNICLKAAENQENLCLCGRSQNFPDAYRLVACTAGNKRTE
jgi:hypothetical protein